MFPLIRLHDMGVPEFAFRAQDFLSVSATGPNSCSLRLLHNPSHVHLSGFSVSTILGALHLVSNCEHNFIDVQKVHEKPALRTGMVQVPSVSATNFYVWAWKFMANTPIGFVPSDTQMEAILAAYDAGETPEAAAERISDFTNAI